MTAIMTEQTFANREEGIPLIGLDAADDFSDTTEDVLEGTPQKENTRQRMRRHASAMKENVRKAQERATNTRTGMQDMFVEKILQQVIPTEDASPSRESKAAPHAAPRDSVERPNFSIPTMSTNFRRFNARIGVVFVFQVKVMRLLSWKQWSHTLSFLAVYTFVCLDPYLLSVLPLATLLLGIFIPSFMARHPAPPTTISSDTYTYSTNGPPIAPAPIVKPVKELSKDFFRNMRDLQNSMEDFSRAHDRFITLVTPSMNFSNEPLSSTLFLFIFVTAAFMFIASHLMPWRLIFLVIGWTITGLGHPAIQRQMLQTHASHIVPREQQAHSFLSSWVATDILLDSAPDTREVEIFELQKLSSAGEWDHWLFSSSPFDPMSSLRVAGKRATGTRFFEDVRAPQGWEWSEKKWALDLWSREWVEERIITGVEVETEGERWVYDIRYEGDEDVVGVSESPRTSGKGKAGVSWEEGIDGESGRRGEWRRRRWVRMVKRKYQTAVSDARKV